MFFLCFFFPYNLAPCLPADPRYDPVSGKGQMHSDWHCFIIGMCVCAKREGGKLFLAFSNKNVQLILCSGCAVAFGWVPVEGQWVYCAFHSYSLSDPPPPSIRVYNDLFIFSKRSRAEITTPDSKFSSVSPSVTVDRLYLLNNMKDMDRLEKNKRLYLLEY